MRPLGRRHKVLAGALAIVASAWGLDYFTAGGKPATVSAATAQPGAPQSVQPVADEVDLDELLRIAERPPPPPPDVGLPSITRDPFVPTTLLRAACGAAGAVRTAEPPPAEQHSSSELPFEQRHRLQGILTGGRVPIALIDGELFCTGAQLDGYTLVRIERDSVVCRAGEREVVLRLPEAKE